MNQIALGFVFASIVWGMTLRVLGHEYMPLAEHEEYVERVKLMDKGRVCEIQKAYRSGLRDGMRKAGSHTADEFVANMPPIPDCTE